MMMHQTVYTAALIIYVKRGDWNGTETYDKRRFGRAKKRTIDLMDDGSVAGM